MLLRQVLATDFQASLLLKILIKFLKESCLTGFTLLLKKKKTKLFTLFNLGSDKNIQLPMHKFINRRFRKQLDGSNYCCSINVDFQEAFDTVDHNVLLKQLEHVIRGTSNKWFACYFSNRKQFVSINGFNFCGLWGAPRLHIRSFTVFNLYK